MPKKEDVMKSFKENRKQLAKEYLESADVIKARINQLKMAKKKDSRRIALLSSQYRDLCAAARSLERYYD